MHVLLEGSGESRLSLRSPTKTTSPSVPSPALLAPALTFLTALKIGSKMNRPGIWMVSRPE